MSTAATKQAVKQAAKTTATVKTTPGARTAATKPAAAAKQPAKPEKLEKADKQDKPAKREPRLVRDSFTMPQSDFNLVVVLKQRAMTGQRQAKKSELLRAGLRALAALSPAALVKALDKLEPVKTGRPKKGQDAVTAA